MEPSGPLIELAIEPKSKSDREKMIHALLRLVQEDPTFRVSTDQETGVTVIKGMGEQHLHDILHSSEFGIPVNVSAPQVAYREMLGCKSEIDYTYKKQIGTSGRFARVKLTFEPGAPGSGYRFENKIIGGSVPEEFISSVEKGLAASRQSGVLAGFPVIDFKASLLDGAFHDWDSNALAFEIAARAAFREGLAKAECKLLEPIMKVEVAIHIEFKEDIVDDLSKRRGEIRKMEARGGVQIINALVPLAGMFGYANTLLSFRLTPPAAYTMAFDHYAPVPLPTDDDPFRPAVGMRA
jgi:elongation factor G